MKNFDGEACDVPHANNWNGYKLVGDNLDKNIAPRYRRIDHQTQSMHFFHCYAVHDRIDLSDVSDELNPYTTKPVSKLPVSDLLPSIADDQALLSNFSVLVSRVLVKEIPYFTSTFEGVVTEHIKHLHYDEMAKKSEIVSVYVSVSVCHVHVCVHLCLTM